MDIEKKYIGKYVCYDQADGGACWGRIKDEGFVTKRDPDTGKPVDKGVFILENRYVRYWRTKDVRNFRKFYPKAAIGDLSASYSGSITEEETLFMETRKVRGDSTLHKDQIDLEKDIIDLDEVLGLVDNDELFKAILNARGGVDRVDGRTAAEIGINALLQDGNLSDEAARVLKKRLGIDI